MDCKAQKKTRKQKKNWGGGADEGGEVSTKEGKGDGREGGESAKKRSRSKLEKKGGEFMARQGRKKEVTAHAVKLH